MAQRAADQITLTDLTDGVSVILSSESYSFPGTTTAAIAGSTTTKIQALMGGEYVAASVNVANVTKPTGITVTSDNHATAPTLTIAIAASVTTPGEIVIPVVVDGLTIEKRFSYSIAFKGTTGTTGNGIASTAVTYQASASGTVTPTGSWVATPPAVPAGQFLWTRTITTYTDASTTTTYSVGGSGTNGVSATYNGLKNEAHSIVTNAAGAALAASTINVDFFGFVGSTRTATTAAVGTLPSGMTVGTNTAGTSGADGILTLLVANGATLGGADSGIVPITLTTGGQARVQNFSWSKAKAGAAGTNGNDGADGANAVTVEVSSSQGLVFKNTQVATILTARVYVGGAEVTGGALTALGTVKWYKDGGSTAVGTGTSLTISAGDVTDRATYEAKLEY
jgi:hypothetical protein